MARAGAQELRREGASGGHPDRDRRSPPPDPLAPWERVDSAPAPKPRASTKRHRSSGAAVEVPASVDTEVRRAARGATPGHREQLVRALHDAAGAYERGRDQEATRIALSLARELPEVPTVRELAGLTAYRSGRWRDAVKHLEAHLALTDDPRNVPALMDAHRALRRHRMVAELWGDLRRRSPEPDVLAEARIVAAGSLADQGDLAGAISLLSTGGAARSLRNPGERHLRQWYALADLYERAGDVPRARELFTRVQKADPEAYDVASRLEALGPARRTGARRPARQGAPPRSEHAPAGARRARPPQSDADPGASTAAR